MSEEHLTDGWEPDLPVADTLLRPLPFDRPGETLEEVEGFFDGQGSGEAYLWSAWPTPDLRRRGWVLEGHPPLVLRTPGSGPVPPIPPGLRVERVGGVDALRDWERVAVDGFPYRELQQIGRASCRERV